MISGYLQDLAKGKAGQAYNIGTESPEVTIAELAEEFSAIGREMLGSNTKLNTKPVMIQNITRTIRNVVAQI